MKQSTKEQIMSNIASKGRESSSDQGRMEVVQKLLDVGARPTERDLQSELETLNEKHPDLDKASLAQFLIEQGWSPEQLQNISLDGVDEALAWRKQEQMHKLRAAQIKRADRRAAARGRGKDPVARISALLDETGYSNLKYDSAGNPRR